MFSSGSDAQLLISYISVVIISLFFISIGTRFIETISDRATETHLAGGFISGLYMGYDLDPDVMILRELVDLTIILDSSFLLSVLVVLNILSFLEIFLGSMYILGKRGKIGISGCIMVICSGYVLPKVEGAILFIFGIILFFRYSDESEF
jgi:hypothetical protein